MTVQRALSRLQDDGFLEARRGLGTRVVQHPPHLYNYLLAFPMHPSNSPVWSRFYTVIAEQAAALAANGPQRMTCLYGVNGHDDSEGMMQLRRTIESKRCAGIIFASSPFELEGTGILAEPLPPKVAITGGHAEHGHYSTVGVDNKAFIERALDHMVERNRRRLSIVLVPGLIRDHMAYLNAAMTKRNLTTEPYWLQTLSQSASEGAASVAHLMFHHGQQERPDGLIVMDDNLVEHAVAGLIAAGVSVPSDVDVVAHCNFPWPIATPIPVRRLGYDARQVLRIAIEQTDALRDGAKPMSLKVAPVFEDELPPEVMS